MALPEGHFTITVEVVGEDCDHGPCRGLCIDELGLVVWLYDNDPTRISFHVLMEGEDI